MDRQGKLASSTNHVGLLHSYTIENGQQLLKPDGAAAIACFLHDVRSLQWVNMVSHLL